jgi:hypothetical protein
LVVINIGWFVYFKFLKNKNKVEEDKK